MKRDVDILSFGTAALHQDLRDSFGDFSLLIGGASLDPRYLHMRHRLSSFGRLRSNNLQGKLRHSIRRPALGKAECPLCYTRRMHSAIPHLIELQRVDQQIAALRAELDSFPRRIREADSKLNGARAAVAAAKEALINSQKDRKKFELDVEQWKDRARKYRDQSGAVKTNEAYRALQHEIANAEVEVAKAEDRELDVMMLVEEAERRVKSSEASLKEAEREVAGERREIEAQQAEKKKLLEAALAERESAGALVPEELRELYARVGKRHNGTALAEVRTEQCRGCGMRVLPHIIQALRQEANEEVYRCESCGLILYTLEPVTAPNPGGTSGNAVSSASSSS
jgi:uncharacterized protein